MILFSKKQKNYFCHFSDKIDFEAENGEAKY